MSDTADLEWLVGRNRLNHFCTETAPCQPLRRCFFRTLGLRDKKLVLPRKTQTILIRLVWICEKQRILCIFHPPCVFFDVGVKDKHQTNISDKSKKRTKKNMTISRMMFFMNLLLFLHGITCWMGPNGLIHPWHRMALAR